MRSVVPWDGSIADSIPIPAQWIKDLALPQLRLQLWHGSDPWLEKCISVRVAKKKKKKKKNHISFKAKAKAVSNRRGASQGQEPGTGQLPTRKCSLHFRGSWQKLRGLTLANILYTHQGPSFNMTKCNIFSSQS